jgi:hypothetical protein
LSPNSLQIYFSIFSHLPVTETLVTQYLSQPHLSIRFASTFLLKQSNRPLHFLGHITIHLDSRAVDREISNIPFLGNLDNAFNTPFAANAFVESARATFWIEWVSIPHYPRIPREPCPEAREIEPYWPEGTYLQLQYSQVVILVFNKVRWPHVTVATLTLSAG